MCSLNNNNEKSNFCKSVYNCLILLSDTSCSNFWIWTEKWIACWLKLNRSDWRSILWKLKFWNYFFFLPCLPSVLEGYFHSITSFKLYMKKNTANDSCVMLLFGASIALSYTVASCVCSAWCLYCHLLMTAEMCLQTLDNQRCCWIIWLFGQY